MANRMIDNKAFEYMTALGEYNLLDDNVQRARDIRPKGMEEKVVGEEGKVFTETHLMTHSDEEIDGPHGRGYYAWPTKFPKLEDGKWAGKWENIPVNESFDESMKRGELFRFNTYQEMIDFAVEGNWKPEED